VSKIHLPEFLPVTLSLVVLAHLIFSRICIGSQLINVLNSNLPHWRTTFSTPDSSQPAYLRSLLSYHTSTLSLRSANTSLLSVPRVRTTFASRSFSIAAPQSGTHYPLASAILPHRTLSVTSLKLTASSRPTASPSGSAKCLRFGHWLTLCTLNMHVLTCLLTYCLYGCRTCGMVWTMDFSVHLTMVELVNSWTRNVYWRTMRYLGLLDIWRYLVQFYLLWVITYSFHDSWTYDLLLG